MLKAVVLSLFFYGDMQGAMGFVVRMGQGPRRSLCSISIPHREILPSLFLRRRGRRSHLLELLLTERVVVSVLPWRSKDLSRTALTLYRDIIPLGTG